MAKNYATHRKQGGLKPCLASALRYCLDIREDYFTIDL